MNALHSIAPADLMAQAFPEHKRVQGRQKAPEDEYQRKLKSVQNRLDSGHNWLLIQQRFSHGILALVLTSEEYKIQNSK